jgi:hypothetical protein
MNKPKVAFVCVHNSCRSPDSRSSWQAPCLRLLMKAILPGDRGQTGNQPGRSTAYESTLWN